MNKMIYFNLFNLIFIFNYIYRSKALTLFSLYIIYFIYINIYYYFIFIYFIFNLIYRSIISSDQVSILFSLRFTVKSSCFTHQIHIFYYGTRFYPYSLMTRQCNCKITYKTNKKARKHKFLAAK